MKGYIFFADGSEECEGLLVVDILRRASVDIEMVSINEVNVVNTAHNISILTDSLISEKEFLDGDFLIIPGGVLGVNNLKSNKKLEFILKKYYTSKKIIAAICAGPSILGELGFLDGKKFTCYPGFEEGIDGFYTANKVEISDNIITGKGLGVALDFAIALVEKLKSKEEAIKISNAIMYNEYK